jgi:putative tricarboxylic transport membrane protein
MTRLRKWLLHRAVLVTVLMPPILMTSIPMASIPTGAHADDKFPSHPITLIVPTPPGGGTDVAARLLSSLAEKTLGQKIIVVDKPGAGGVIGVEEMLRAAPDGYTIAGVWNSPLTITPQLYPVSYKQDAYLPIVLSDTSPLAFCVMKDFPAKDGKALIALLKASPNKYTYGTDGVSGTVHLAAELMFSALGVKARAIPYGGAGETLTAFMGHSVDIYGGSLPPILPFVQNGTAQCLMLSSTNGNTMLPGAASLADLGIPQNQTLLWHAVIAPAGIPKDRLAILEHAFQEAASSIKYQEFAKKQGEEAVAWKSVEARAFIDKEYAALSGVVAELGLAPGSHPAAGQNAAPPK